VHLWVIRHAKSSWSQPVGDHERDLNKRGRRDGPRMAEWLASQAPAPTHIASSDAVRTRRTSEYLRKACGLADTAVVHSADLYLGSIGDLMSAVRALPEACECAAIVGHNPGITDFANTLLDRPRIDDMPTFGIAGVRLRGPWSTVQPGCGELTVFCSPKRLKED
jgi:phosphohistidine phosphatase